jgi:hypothetical protein
VAGLAAAAGGRQLSRAWADSTCTPRTAQPPGGSSKGAALQRQRGTALPGPCCSQADRRQWQEVGHAQPLEVATWTAPRQGQRAPSKPVAAPPEQEQEQGQELGPPEAAQQEQAPGAPGFQQVPKAAQQEPQREEKPPSCAQIPQAP